LRSRNIVLDFGVKAVDNQSKENASKALGYVNQKQCELKTLIDAYESQQTIFASNFDLYKRTIRHVADSDPDIYSIWFSTGSNVLDTTKQNYIYSKENESESGRIASMIDNQLSASKVKNSGETAISEPININGTWTFGISLPVIDNGKIIGVAGFIIKNDALVNIVNSAMPSDEGSCKIVTGNGIIIAHPVKSNIGTETFEGENTNEVLEHIKKGEFYANNFYSKTFNGMAYKAFVPITFEGTKYTWSFCTVVPTDIMLYQTHTLMMITIILIIIGISALIFVTNLLSRRLTRPIIKTSEQLTLISEGRLNQTTEININNNDEIGDMVRALNLLTDSQKRLADFANEVGHGNLDAEIGVKNDQDLIGLSMVEMKRNLTEARKVEEQRKIEEDIQSWKVTGNARIHELIRKENASIKHLCTTTIQEIITYSGAIQGGVFVIDDTDENEKYVDLVACIAYSRAKLMKKRMPIEEGLIGRCIFEKAPIILSELPQNYLEITSGLGDKNPSFLVIMPLINNESIVGVLEIASFKVFDTHVLEYLTKAAESIASAISNVRINERTQRLLEQSKQYAEEMSAQEEELRQNMEEMQAAQEEMYRKSHEYEETISRLKEELNQRK
jgi:Cache domain./HAMP domain.